jgi:hypothetical protein
VWIWDDDNSAWVDSDQKGQVTSVNNQTGAVTVSEVPNQTGNSGKFLTTDGTNASWSDKPLVNNGTGTYSVGISKESVQTLGDSNINIGGYVGNANAYRNVVIGVSARTGYTNSYYSNDSVYIGWNAQPWTGNKSYVTAVGASTWVNANYATAIGCGASAMADGAIQLGGRGSGSQRRNEDANTFKVGNANGNYEIMSADGTIPEARLTNAINKYSTMPTAASTNEGWIVQFTGTTDANYTHGYIYECKAQGTDPETYAWEAVEVQASSGGGGLPSQTGNAGKFLITDGTDASWSDKPLVNNATINTSISIGGETIGYMEGVAIGVNSMLRANCVAIGYNTQIGSRNVAIGHHASAKTSYGGSVAIGYGANADISPAEWYASVAIGPNAIASADGAIQICSANIMNLNANKTNNDANTFKVANNNGNYEMMDANGNLPADRLASITGLADGNYRLRLTMASGVPTLSWVAE